MSKSHVDKSMYARILDGAGNLISATNSGALLTSIEGDVVSSNRSNFLANVAIHDGSMNSLSSTANALHVDIQNSSLTVDASSSASLPLPNGASTSAKQPNFGTAGNASADVLTVQGVAGMNSLDQINTVHMYKTDNVNASATSPATLSESQWSCKGVASYTLNFFADQNGTMNIEGSEDGITFQTIVQNTTVSGTAYQKHDSCFGDYMRAYWTNDGGSTTTTCFNQIVLHSHMTPGALAIYGDANVKYDYHSGQAVYAVEDDSLSTLAGGDGTYNNLRVSQRGALWTEPDRHLNSATEVWSNESTGAGGNSDAHTCTGAHVSVYGDVNGATTITLQAAGSGGGWYDVGTVSPSGAGNFSLHATVSASQLQLESSNDVTCTADISTTP